MRLAAVIKSAYAENTVVVRRDAFLDNAELVRKRCRAADACFEVVELDATRDLPEVFEELLRSRGGKLESLLVHFTGYIAVKADRGPALLLDGNRLRAFPLSRLRAAIEAGAQQSLVIINGLAVVDSEQAPDAVARAVGEAMTSPNGTITSLIGIEQEWPQERRGPQRLTDLFVLALDHLASKTRGGLVTAKAVYQSMQGDTMSFASIAGVVHQSSNFDFMLLEGPSAEVDAGHPTAQERVTQRVPVFSSAAPALSVPSTPRTSATVPQTQSADGSGTKTPVPAASTDLPVGNGDQSSSSSPAANRAEQTASPATSPDGAAGSGRVQTTVGKRGERRIPTVADTPIARAAIQRDWTAEAAYFPSAPPPPVSPQLPFEQATHRSLQRTLPGIVEDDLSVRTALGPPAPEAEPIQLQPLASFELEDDAPEPPRDERETPRGGAESLRSFAESLQPNPETELPDAEPESAAEGQDDPEADQADESRGEPLSSASNAEPEFENTDAVIALYESLLARLDETEDPRRTEVQAKLGDALRERERTAEALFAYERALDIDPLQPDAFEGACAIYREGRDFAGLVSTIRRKMEISDDPGERLYLLDEIAEIWLSDAGDVARGIEALEERLEETPDDVATLRHLIEAQDRAGDLLGRIDSRELLAKSRAAEPGLRAAAWVEAAALACSDLNDLARTFLMLESAIETGVYLPHALNRAETLLGQHDRWLEVIELYEMALDTVSSEPDAIHIATRLVDLLSERNCRNALKPGSLSAIVRIARRDAYLAELTIALVESMTEGGEKIESLQRIRSGQPQYAPLLHRIVELTRKTHPDVAINIASVLTATADADEREKELAAILATGTLPTPSRALDRADCESLLYPSALDLTMTEGLARLERALFAASAFERRTAIAVPKDAAVIDPESSTITLARSLLWSSRLLSVNVPGLVLLADAPMLFRYVPQAEPRLLASRSLGSGFSLPELVYLGARQAALQLPGLIVREHCGDPQALASLLHTLAIVADGRKSGIKALADSEQKLGKRILAQLESDPNLENEILRLVGTEKPSLEFCERRAETWMKAVDQVRLNAALLACGTPSIAIELNRKFPLDSLWSEGEQIDLLAAFAGSPEHCELRARLAIAAERLSHPQTP